MSEIPVVLMLVRKWQMKRLSNEAETFNGWRFDLNAKMRLDKKSIRSPIKLTNTERKICDQRNRIY